MSAETPPSGPAAGPYTLEHEQRLSRSLLWRAQRGYFDRHGADAFRSGAVPHYITNNPALAHAYAQVVLGFLRDLRARPDHDATEPLTLVELGAGSGRFAFLFLRALLDLLERSPLCGARVRYVMTDFTRANQDYWLAHPALQRWLDEGTLDVATFNVEQDEALTLRRAGITLSPGALRNPLLVIANYVFDGISQDAFSLRARTLHECLLTVNAPEPDPDLSDTNALARLDLRYTHRPVALPYYGEEELDALLADHVAALGDQAAVFLFPSGALRCLQRLARLSGGRALLLVGDRGASEDERGGEVLQLALHGSFSTTVNFALLAAFARAQGGRALAAPHHHPPLHVAGFVLGCEDVAEVAFAYHLAFAQGGPDAVYPVQLALRERLTALPLDGLVGLLRLSHADPRVLLDCVPHLCERIQRAGEAERRDVHALVQEAWENYYSIPGDPDVAFALAVLLYEAGGCQEALALFQRSADVAGEDERTVWNRALCRLGLGDLSAALSDLVQLRSMQPALRPRALLRE